MPIVRSDYRFQKIFEKFSRQVSWQFELLSCLTTKLHVIVDFEMLQGLTLDSGQYHNERTPPRSLLDEVFRKSRDIDHIVPFGSYSLLLSSLLLAHERMERQFPIALHSAQKELVEGFLRSIELRTGIGPDWVSLVSECSNIDVQQWLVDLAYFIPSVEKFARGVSSGQLNVHLGPFTEKSLQNVEMIYDSLQRSRPDPNPRFRNRAEALDLALLLSQTPSSLNRNGKPTVEGSRVVMLVDDPLLYRVSRELLREKSAEPLQPRPFVPLSFFLYWKKVREKELHSAVVEATTTSYEALRDLKPPIDPRELERETALEFVRFLDLESKVLGPLSPVLASYESLSHRLTTGYVPTQDERSALSFALKICTRIPTASNDGGKDPREELATFSLDRKAIRDPEEGIWSLGLDEEPGGTRCFEMRRLQNGCFTASWPNAKETIDQIGTLRDIERTGKVGAVMEIRFATTAADRQLSPLKRVPSLAGLQKIANDVDLVFLRVSFESLVFVTEGRAPSEATYGYTGVLSQRPFPILISTLFDRLGLSVLPKRLLQAELRSFYLRVDATDGQDIQLPLERFS